MTQQTTKLTTTIDYNLERIQHNAHLDYPRLNWNRARLATSISSGDEQQQQQHEAEAIESELNRFYDVDLMCKELEVYYKCKHMQSQLVDKCALEFVERHSLLDEHRYAIMGGSGAEQRHNAEFYELVRDYYEARRLVVKLQKHIGDFKRSVLVGNMKKAWAFEKYTIESFGTCGDQQRVKHELTSEKAYLNKIELTKLQVTNEEK